MTYAIRAYRDGDAPALAQLFYDSIRQAARRDYSQAQVEAWAPRVQDPSRFATKASDGRVFLVAVDGKDEPIAFGDLEADGHIDYLYCRPDFVDTGIASALYDRLEAIARSRAMPRLYTEASELARRLFARKGFAVVTRRDFDLNGVDIHNYAMEKFLS
ncbi:MAG TPA: GNAT family N-acetyltransferase [Rhizomicrobium sp.]|jgi:putative acetyltransferase|nr:GNAT family N-acetyltransferase [Rhizomicrobium sp.]